MMSRSFLFLFLLLALSTMLSVPAAHARRTLSFEGYDLPTDGVVAIAVAQDLPEGGAFSVIDARTDGALRRIAATEGFKGGKGTSLDLRGFGGYGRLLVVGLGDAPLSPVGLEDVGGTVAQALGRSRAPQVQLVWDGHEPEASSHLAFGAVLGQYRFDKYRTNEDDEAAPGAGKLVIRSHAGSAASAHYASQWKPVADAVAFARDLVTEPANVLSPEAFVARVRSRADGLPVRIEVLDVPAM